MIPEQFLLAQSTNLNLERKYIVVFNIVGVSPALM